MVPGGVVACGGLLGVAQGLSTLATAVLLVRYFGRLNLGRIRGVLSTAVVGSSSLGPFLVGLTYDLTGGYGPILWAFTAAAVAGCGAAFLATPPAEPARIAALDPAARAV